MINSVGMAAAYGGYQAGRQMDQQIDKSDIELQQLRTAQEGDAAWGNAIPVLQQMLMPGAQSMEQGPQQGGQPPLGSSPQPPMPGQASTPMELRPPQQTAGPPQYPQPQMLGGPPPPNDPTWTTPQRPPMQQPGGGQPQQNAPTPPSAPPMQQPGQQPQQGRLDLHTVMAAVVKANPGAKPAVLAAAIAKALPLMTAQSQIDYKNMMIQLGLVREGGRNDRNDANIGSRETIATGNQNTRRDVAVGNQESRERVAEGNQQTRRDVAAESQDRQDIRQDKSIGSREGVAARREEGLTTRFEARKEYLNKRIELQSQNLERQVKRDQTLEDNARNRQTLKVLEDENRAEFDRVTKRIQAQNVMAGAKTKDALMKDAEVAYQATQSRIQRFKQQMGGGSPAAPGGDAEQPPPKALKYLKEGQGTTFGNGQIWTLEGGKPKRVK